MLDSEPNNNETGTSEATGQAAGTAPAPTVFNGPAEPSAVPSVPAAVFQPPPVVLFQAPAAAPAPRATRDADDDEGGGDGGSRDGGGRDSARDSGDREPADNGKADAEPDAGD